MIFPSNAKKDSQFVPFPVGWEKSSFFPLQLEWLLLHYWSFQISSVHPIAVLSSTVQLELNINDRHMPQMWPTRRVHSKKILLKNIILSP